MSHFTVMVITPPAPQAPTQDELHAVLLPWHEYECTGYTEYCVWVDETEKLLKRFAERSSEEQKSYPTVEVFAEEYYGYGPIPDKPGRFGHFTNPNRKWDWWVIGGRWSGMLRDAAGGERDQLRVGDIALSVMRESDAIAAGERYDAAHVIIAGESFISWKDVLAKHPDNIDAARAEYNAQPIAKRWRESREFLFDNPANFTVTREAYMQAARDRALSTFAVVRDGAWYEKGKMGWWGIATDEEDQATWNKKINELFGKLSPDTWITIVDCHI